MKNFILSAQTLCALLIAGAAFTACSSDDNKLDDSSVENPATQKYTMTVKASKGDDATTRGLSLDGSTLNVKWNEGEVVEVYQVQDKTDVHLGTLHAAASSDGSTTLTGTLDVAPITGESIYFYLNNSYNRSYSDQNGVLLAADNADKSIEKDYDFAHTFVSSDGFTISGYNVTVPNGITLVSEQAIVKFTLEDASGNDLNVTSLTVNDIAHDIQGGGSHISGAPLVVTPSDATNVLYVAISNLYDGKNSDFVLTATTANGDTYTYTKPYAGENSVHFEHGKYYAITVKMTKQVTVTDLSMLDCAGNARSSRWTANCYMVHTAGDYKLPLVYGNAIKNGQDNTVAYNPGGTASDTYCTNFVNHANESITAPWITKSTSGTGVNKGMGIGVTSAELLWQDAQGLITAVGIDGDYLTLTVGKDATTQEGNAVVAAKDADGTIVWSWHIWVTKQTFASTDLTTVATGSHNYIVTPVNLGWVGDPVSQGYCTYYQWGRKDAFIPSTGTADTNHKVYDINDAKVTGLTSQASTTASTTATIADNIKTPTYYYVNSTTCGSCITTYFNMWDAQQTTTDNDITTPTKKTVYDPCPAGFCVPTGNLYYFIKYGSGVSFAWDSTNKGRNLTSVKPNVFFPASGYRTSSNASLVNVGSIGYAWSASADGGRYGRNLYFDSSSWILWYSDFRADGYPVRAVAEE